MVSLDSPLALALPPAFRNFNLIWSRLVQWDFIGCSCVQWKKQHSDQQEQKGIPERAWRSLSEPQHFQKSQHRPHFQVLHTQACCPLCLLP